MPAPIRVLLVATALAGVAPYVSAQASPYIPFDDPRLPLLEHLIARGEIEDPAPLVRPFRHTDVVRVLAQPDSGAAPAQSRLRLHLQNQLGLPASDNHWAVEGRAGGQAYTHGRRELLHPAGAGRTRPYVSLRADAVIGKMVLATRPVIEPRLLDDPDWVGRKELKVVGRMADAYLSVQFNWGSLFYGILDRNWGPVGYAGIPLSNYGYSRETAAFDIGTRGFRLHAMAADLRDERNTAGEVVHRYFFAHRLGLRLSRRVQLAIWETTVVAGPGRNFDGRFRNPLSLLLLANQYGQGDEEANVLVGFDLHWRAFKGATLQAQVGLDDIQYENRSGPNRYPDRWALTLAAFGPLGRAMAWRALYTQASALAFRTLDPFQNLTEVGVGLGRNFADMDQLTLSTTVPVAGGWLVTPEATLLRQGEGRIGDPFPVTSEEAGALPQIFIGTVEKTFRVAVGLSGRQGPLDLLANVGFHHVRDADHQEGRTANRFEGRLQATLGLSRAGVLQ